MVSMEHEAPSKRRFYRFTSALTIEICGKRYRTLDWSFGGFRIGEFDGDLTAGTLTDAKVCTKLDLVEVSFTQKVRIIRVSKGDAELAAEFIDLSDNARELLSQLSESLATGDAYRLDEFVKRLEIPADDPGDNLLINSTQSRVAKQVRRFALFSFYLVVGIAITAYLASAVYSYMYRLQVETAVVWAPVEPVIAPDSGVIEQWFVAEEQEIQKGDPLFQLRNADLELAISTLQSDIRETEAKVGEYEAKIADQRLRMEIYESISQSRLEASSSAVRGLKREHELANGLLDRRTQLLEAGIVDKDVVDERQLQVTELQRRLQVARSQQEVDKAAAAGIEHGVFFTGHFLEGELAVFKAELETAKQVIAARIDKLEAMRARRDALMVNAPFQGRVRRVLKSSGNIVEKEKPVVLIERSDSKLIAAFLTQAEVIDVPLHNATVHVPSFNAHYEAEVTEVNRTSAFLDEVNHQFHWRKPEDPTAVVTLELTDPRAIQSLPTGLPVVVNFPRARTGEAGRTVKAFLRMGTKDVYASDEL